MSLPRYAGYKSSNALWLGEVPAHWDVVQIKRVTRSIEQGWSPQCESFPVESPEEWGVMKVGCVNGGTFRPSENKKLPAELQPMPQYALKRGDLLISRANTRELVGSAAAVPDDFDNLLLCDKLYRLRTSDELSLVGYLAYYLRTEQARSQIELDATGASSSMLNIGQSAILDLLMPLPSRTEQKAITVFLDRETAKIDALIAEQEKLIALLAEKRQSTISHAVTRGLNPDAPMKDSGVAWLGEVPTHWEVKRLKFIASVQTGIAKGKDITGKETCTVPYLRVANVQDGYLALEEIATIDIEVEQLERYRLVPGDVLMNEGGDFDKLGRGAIWRGEIADCIHQNHVFAVRPHGVSSEWLNRITSSQYAQFYFMSRSKQSTNLASISSTNIMELPVVLPPPNEQHAILAYVDSEVTRLDGLKHQVERAIGLLGERRSALIAAAVTGKVDVRGGIAAPSVVSEELAA